MGLNLKSAIEREITENDTKLYGVILFTRKHPFISQMLKEEEFYTSLDLRSNEDIDIFVTMRKEGEWRTPEPLPGTMQFLKPIWIEPKENEELFSVFNIDTSDSLPLFVLFGGMEDANENLKFSFYNKTKIKTTSKETAYQSIEDTLTIVTKVIEKLKAKESYTIKDLEKSLSKEIKLTKLKINVKEVIKKIPVGSLIGKLF